MNLKGKHYIHKYSYRPEEVRDHEAAGLPIYDIVTTTRGDECIPKWFKHFHNRGVPVFAERLRTSNGTHKVKLWVKRTVYKDGTPCSVRASSIFPACDCALYA